MPRCVLTLEQTQTLVGGMGELHLEYIMDRLFKHYGVTGTVGRIMIAYRCALRSVTEGVVETEHDYETPSGKRTHAQVKARIRTPGLDSLEAADAVEDMVTWAGLGGKLLAEDKRSIKAFEEVSCLCVCVWVGSRKMLCRVFCLDVLVVSSWDFR